MSLRVLRGQDDPAIFMIDTGYSYSEDVDTYYAATNISKIFQYLYWGRYTIAGVREITTKALNNQDIPLVYKPNDASFIVGLSRINESVSDMIAKGLIKKCSDCNKLFITDEEEREWYITKGLELPKRCSSCRTKRKKTKKS